MGPDGALLLNETGGTRQATARDFCYEYIAQDGRSGIFSINCPGYDVEIVSVTPGQSALVTVTLHGGDIVLEDGEPYVESGATAEGTMGDGAAIAISGTVGSEPGEYTITYTATDINGDIATASRTVTVTNSTPPQSVRAFPGAVGFGAESVGGRTGNPVVYVVSNLDDSGAGSFREACEAVGPRYVVFATSGIINLNTPLMITNGNITIAGQTSPGGILITGKTFQVNAANVIVRHMRFRVGSHGASDPDTHDAVQIWGNDDPGVGAVRNIIFDHCSIGWGIDECMDTAYNPVNMTLQNCLIGPGLAGAGHSEGAHNMGFLHWASQSPDSTLTMFENYFASNKQRNPEIQGHPNGQTQVELINNVGFDSFGGFAKLFLGRGKFNDIGNFFRRGAANNAAMWEASYYESGSPEPTIFMSGTRGINSPATDPEWRVADGWTTNRIPTTWRQDTEWAMSAYPPARQEIADDDMADDVITRSGATMPITDSVDQQIKQNALDARTTTPSTDYFPGDVAYPADFPAFATPPPPPDGDGDGIPDGWTSPGWNPPTTAATDAAPSGYLWIEEYINSLA